MKKLVIANLGDSLCILGKKINNEWKAENLTRDPKGIEEVVLTKTTEILRKF